VAVISVDDVVAFVLFGDEDEDEDDDDNNLKAEPRVKGRSSISMVLLLGHVIVAVAAAVFFLL